MADQFIIKFFNKYYLYRFMLFNDSETDCVYNSYIDLMKSLMFECLFIFVTFMKSQHKLL